MNNDDPQPPASPAAPRKGRAKTDAPSTGEGADSALAALIKKRNPLAGTPPVPQAPDELAE